MSVVNKVDQFINDSDLAHRIVHGANGEMVQTEGGMIPTYATAVGGMVGAEKRIAALEDGQSAGRIVKKLWAELNTLVGIAGQGADVVADAGSHIDPVSAGSVPNQGVYIWNASSHAWEWVRADSLSMKASTDDLAREAAARATLASITPRNGHRWRSTGKTLRWALLDRAGKAILSLDRKLRMQVASLRLLDDGVRRRSTRNTLYSIADATGHRLFALFTDGSAWLKLSDSVVADIAKRLDVVEPATLRGNAAATDISATANLVRAQVRHGNWFGSVVQPRIGLLPTAVATLNDQLLLILFYGQSNAGGGGTASGILTAADHPHHALTFDASYHQYGTAPVDASAITDLVPLKDPPQQAFAATSTAFALSSIASARGERSPAVLGRTDWYGSQPLSTFVRGTVPWSNAHVSIDKAFGIGQDKYGLAVRPTIVWVQGEAGSGTAGGREAYASALDALIRDMRKEVRSRHGVLPDWITWQICHASAVANGSTLAFRDVAQMWRNSPVVLAGPLYAMPFSDGIHYTAEGRMMQGEVTAMVTRSLQRVGTWAPLEPVSVKRTGRMVVVDFLNPGAPLQFDHDWIEPAPSMGFSWRDDSVGAEIANVEITGRDQVTITLSALPTGAGNLLRYAVDPSPPDDARWGAYRGQLYAPSGVDSPYAALGHQVPSDIRFYCIAFEEKVP